MGTESGGKMEPVLKICGRTSAEIEIGKILRHMGQVGNGRGHPFLKGLDQHRILDGRPQGMAGKPFGVGDGHPPVMIRIRSAQGVHLGIGTAAPGRGKGFMTHENHGRGIVLGRKTVALLDAADEPGHLAAHMVHFDAGGMKGAVADIGTEDFGLAVQPPLGQGVGPFHDHRHRTAAKDGAVALGVKGFGRIGHHGIDGGRPQGQKPRGHPGALGLRRGRLPADDDHPVATAGSDPVLGHAHGLGGGGAGPAHLHIGAFGADELGKMGRPQGCEVKEQGPVELVVAVAFAPLADFKEPVGDLFLDVPIGHRSHEVVVDVLQLLVRPDIELVVIVVVHLVDEGFKSREERGENHTGAVLHGLGQNMAVGELLTRAGRLVSHHQRDMGVLQGLDPRGDGQLVGDVIVKIDAVFAL